MFDLNWTAEEESALIDSVEQYGLGNWEEVAVNVPSKTAREVEEHYLTIYVDGYLGKVTAPASVPNRITDHTPPIYGILCFMFCDKIQGLTLLICDVGSFQLALTFFRTVFVMH